MFFGSVTKLEQVVDPTGVPPGVVILELHQVINMDNTALDALEHLHGHLRKHDARLMLVAPNEQPLNMMRRGGFVERLGKENLFADLDDAFDALTQSGSAEA